MSSNEDVEEISTSGVQGSDIQMSLSDINTMLADPAAMAAFANQLQSMVGMSSDLIETLPPAARRRVKALKKLQRQHLELELAFHEEVASLERKYQGLYRPLYEKRRAIVNGDVEPTDEEAQWPPAGAEGEEPEPEEDNEDDEDDEEDPNAHHLDKFWFACLCNNPQISQLIMEHDEAVLEYLTDISGEYKEPGLTGFTLTFTFRENPYFTNTTISKTYNLAPGPEEDDELEYNGPIFQSAVADPINWKEGMDVTVKSVTKKQRKKTGKNKGDTRTVTKSVPQESFFHFFTPPQLNPEEASEEEIQTAAELLNTDYLIGEVFLNDIIPKAVLWYTGEAEFSSDDEEEEEEEEDDYEDEDDDDEDDPDYVPPAGGQAPECKQS